MFIDQLPDPAFGLTVAIMKLQRFQGLKSLKERIAQRTCTYTHLIHDFPLNVFKRPRIQIYTRITRLSFETFSRIGIGPECARNVQVVVDVGSQDLTIRSLTLSFAQLEQCPDEAMPKLLEWIKPHYRPGCMAWLRPETP